MSAAAIATEVEQQLEPIARGFDVVQRSKQQLATSIEQLATKIDELAANQVTQNSATLQAVEQDNSQTTSSPSPGASTTADAGQQVSDKCHIEACKQAYFTFNPADCTYQPNNPAPSVHEMNFGCR